MSTDQSVTQDSSVKEVQDAFIKKLEDDDEFEDFPEDDWEDPEVLGNSNESNLWEKSWEDHDDYKDNFTERLRNELAKSSSQTK
ncbi:hypothetical protein CANINC_002781 [Pichia inconspicua]|uniref:26S proteasome complex subunit SEM1 n=1 Tax=Pichia inconspicua TaxID=52247 RepID=A0A4T0X0B9_9ASCO|nr:hypothetical protein CANINC_002781 [[Candida] inconspicua]